MGSGLMFARRFPTSTLLVKGCKNLCGGCKRRDHNHHHHKHHKPDEPKPEEEQEKSEPPPPKPKVDKDLPSNPPARNLVLGEDMQNEVKLSYAGTHSKCPDEDFPYDMSNQDDCEKGHKTINSMNIGVLAISSVGTWKCKMEYHRCLCRLTAVGSVSGGGPGGNKEMDVNSAPQVLCGKYSNSRDFFVGLH